MSCFKKERPPGKPVNRKVDLEGFYKLRANTANGKPVRLEQFDVYDTVVYSVARLCGKQMVNMKALHIFCFSDSSAPMRPLRSLTSRWLWYGCLL